MKTTAFLAILAAGATSVSAVAVADAEAQWCQWVGEPCWKVKRTAEAFADVVAGASGFTGRSVGSAVADNAKRGLDDLAGIIASTQHSPRSFYTGLNLGAAFPAADVSKREAEASPEAEAQWCQWVGEPCWKVKRAAEAVVSTIEGFSSMETKRDANANPAVEARCHAPGGACVSARRDLAGIYNVAREVLESLPTQ